MLIQRPVKQFGFRTYTADFAAAPVNPTPPPSNLYEIQTAEVDGDLDTIYALINGGLQNDNIAAGANIDGSKINVTTFADNSIPGAKLIDESVTLAKLAPGAAVRGAVDAVFVSPFAANNAVELAFLTLPAITTSGGLVMLAGTGGLDVNIFGATGGIVTIKLFRDATLLETLDVTVAASGAGGTYPFPTPTFFDMPVAGTYVYKLTAVTNAAAVTVEIGATNPGHYQAREFA